MTEAQQTPEDQIRELQEILISVRQQGDADRRAFQQEIETLQNSLRNSREYIVELEQRVAAGTNLQAQLNDATQERDRLKQLLLGILPSMDEFSVDYPQATIARTAFQGDTSEEIALKMAEWDAARTQKASEWNALKAYVRTQATV